MDDFEAALIAKVTEADEAPTITDEETPVEVEADNVEGEVEEVELDEEVAEAEEPQPSYKFRSQEEAEKAHANIESAFHKRDEEIRQLREAVQAQSAQQQQPRPNELQEALETNPRDVALWATQNGNDEVYEKAMSAWYEKAMDEGDAAELRDANRFERYREMADFQHQLSSSLTPALQNVKSESEVRALALAQRELRSQYPDFDQVMESATDDTFAGLNPQVVRQLKDTDPKAALEVIYRWARSGVVAEQAVASDERNAANLEKKRQAVVASSTSAPVEGKKSGKELLKEFMLEPEAHSVRHGLTS